MSDFDVIVLGGGPGGAAAAIGCAAAALRVLVLERDGFPRHAPGEALHPGAQVLFRQMGVEDAVLAAGFLRYPGHRVCWGGSDELQLFGQDEQGPWLGFQVWRPTFDQILIARARELGAEVLYRVQVTGLIRRPGAMGVLTDRGLFRAPFIIDATGRRRAASGWLNIPWNRRGPERRAWYGYVTADDRAADAPTLTADEAGWTWVAQVRPDLCQWVRLNFDNSQPTATWRPPQLAGLTACGPLRGADVTCRISRRTAGNGYFLVGDAAAILDPISSHGVLKALMSGTMAAHLIRQVLGGDVSPLSASRYYKKWIGDWFEYDAAQLDALYAQLGRVPLGQIPANR